MTEQPIRARGKSLTGEAVVWIDDDQAVIVENTTGGWERARLLDRAPAESQTAFDTRTVDEVLHDVLVMVSGPANARTEFERAYVAVTHRPDRLVEPKA